MEKISSLESVFQSFPQMSILQNGEVMEILVAKSVGTLGLVLSMPTTLSYDETEYIHYDNTL